MVVQGQEERDEEVVSIPKGFKGLIPYFVVGSGVDEQHA